MKENKEVLKAKVKGDKRNPELKIGWVKEGNIIFYFKGKAPPVGKIIIILEWYQEKNGKKFCQKWKEFSESKTKFLIKPFDIEITECMKCGKELSVSYNSEKLRLTIWCDNCLKSPGSKFLKIDSSFKGIEEFELVELK